MDWCGMAKETIADEFNNVRTQKRAAARENRMRINLQDIITVTST